MVGAVKAARLYGGLAAETTLDPKSQPFLFDHQIDGVPVLPGVMGTETFAELATVLCPGFRAGGGRGRDFLAPFKFHRNQPATLHLAAVARPAGIGEVLVSATLRSDRPAAGPSCPRRSACTSRPTRADAARGAREAEGRASRSRRRRRSAIGRDAIYAVYFHGPAYQVIDKAAVDDASVVALMADGLGPERQPGRGGGRHGAAAAGAAVPDGGPVAARAAGTRWRCPTGLDAARFYRQPEEANGKRLYALVDVREDGAAFDGRVVDEKGLVYAEVVAYRTVALPEKKTLQALRGTQHETQLQPGCHRQPR